MQKLGKSTGLFRCSAGQKTFFSLQIHLGTYASLYSFERSLKWPFSSRFSSWVDKNIRLHHHAKPTLNRNANFEAIYNFPANSYQTSAQVKSIPWHSSSIVLKFQRNWTKPALIRIYLSSLYQHLRAKWKQPSPIPPKKTEHYTRRRFGQQNPQLWPQSWKLNGNIFFELFLSDLDEKIYLDRLQMTKHRHARHARVIFFN